MIFSLELTHPNIWTLYFDGSRNKEGEGVVCLLIDLHGNRMMIACHLEFEYIGNDAKYEALIQGLRKEINLKVKSIEVFGDSRLVIKQVRNLMFSTFDHLTNYQQEVWILINKFDSFDIKFIPHTKTCDTIMLIDKASNLNLNDGSIYIKFDVDNGRPLIPCTDLIKSNND